MKKMIIATNYSILREEWKQILSGRFPEIEFGEAEDGQEALQAVKAENWDVMLMDIDLPSSGGLDILKEVKQAKPKLPVIILGMPPEDQFAIPALKSGGSAYMRKDGAGSELVKAVECALNGSRYVTPLLAEQLMVDDQNGAPHKRLSNREHQVLCLLASGKTVKEAGSHLALGVKTVSTYRTRILKKMGLRNNSQLMRYAARNGLIDLC